MIGRLIRYAVVGLSANFLGYLLYLLITDVGLDPKLAMTILYVSAATIGFFGHKKWTFAQRGGFWRSAAWYIAIYLLGYLVNLSMLLTMSDILGYPHQVVQAAAVFVVAILLFTLMGRFAFRSPAVTESSG